LEIFMLRIAGLSRRSAIRGGLAAGVGAFVASWPFDGQRVFADESASATPSVLDPLARQHEVMAADTNSDEISVHGMLVAGEATLYLSHLPMFTDPAHRFQVIMEATLTSPGEDLHAAYRADRQASGATLYTIQPDPTEAKLFALRELLPGSSQQRQFFGATLFRGHFERPGNEPILAGTVEITRIVRFERLDMDASTGERLEYLLFGGNGEHFLAHIITGPPDFDQVLTVQAVDLDIPVDMLRQGLLLTVPDRENSIAHRLHGGETVTVEATGIEPARDIPVVVGTELYFEEGELRVPETFDDTAAEIMAGMP
jgi:hypothetical protein